MTFGSLFAGIGGMDLGLERAGMECRWQVEIDPFCRKVLEKHWPDVPKYEDVRDVGKANLEPVDLICGGFPCQDISYAGKGAGLDGERSGLWWEFARIIREMGPRLVFVENVPALLGRGLGDILGTLSDLGYDAEWFVLSANDMGAPHLRKRVFIMANPEGERIMGGRSRPERPRGARTNGSCDVGDADVSVMERLRPVRKQEPPVRRGAQQPQGASDGVGHSWATEPDVGRVADGVPDRVDRLRALGNAVVPQVAEWIGRRIMEAQP